MENITLVDNLEKCPSYFRCHQNLCPLDFELKLRTGHKGDRCKYMREPRETQIQGKKFISGGTAMPDVLLRFVPIENLVWLNSASRQRHTELNHNFGKFTTKS